MCAKCREIGHSHKNCPLLNKTTRTEEEGIPKGNNPPIRSTDQGRSRTPKRRQDRVRNQTPRNRNAQGDTTNQGPRRPTSDPHSKEVQNQKESVPTRKNAYRWIPKAMAQETQAVQPDMVSPDKELVKSLNTKSGPIDNSAEPRSKSTPSPTPNPLPKHQTQTASDMGKGKQHVSTNTTSRHSMRESNRRRLLPQVLSLKELLLILH